MRTEAPTPAEVGVNETPVAVSAKRHATNRCVASEPVAATLAAVVQPLGARGALARPLTEMSNNKSFTCVPGG